MVESFLTKEVKGTMGSLLGSGSSIIFYGPPSTGKKLRIKALRSIFSDQSFGVSLRVMFHTRGTMSLSNVKSQIDQYNIRQPAVTEQFFLACDTYHDDVRETRTMLDEIVLQYPKFNIQIVQLFGDNDDYLDAVCSTTTDKKVYVDKATNWAKSWVYFKDFNSSIDDVKKTLLTSTDFFEHLPAPSASVPTIDDTAFSSPNVDRIISLYLQGVDFSNQDDYTGDYTDHYKERIENHVASLTSSIKMATNFIDDLINIILHL